MDTILGPDTTEVDTAAFPPVEGIRLCKRPTTLQVWYPGAHGPASRWYRWVGAPSGHTVASYEEALARCASWCWEWHGKLAGGGAAAP